MPFSIAWLSLGISITNVLFLAHRFLNAVPAIGVGVDEWHCVIFSINVSILSDAVLELKPMSVGPLDNG